VKRLRDATASALRELAGLFVEDRAYALAIGLWVALCAIALRTTGARGAAAGTMFAAGFCLILLANVVRTARGKNARPKRR
jgi:hypothetical protein